MTVIIAVFRRGSDTPGPDRGGCRCWSRGRRDRMACEEAHTAIGNAAAWGISGDEQPHDAFARSRYRLDESGTFRLYVEKD